MIKLKEEIDRVLDIELLNENEFSISNVQLSMLR
jgi:hypothetical protein